MRRVLLFILVINFLQPNAQILRVDKNHLESDSAGYFASVVEGSYSLDNRSLSQSQKLIYQRLNFKSDLLYVAKKHAYIWVNGLDIISSTNAQKFSTGFTHFRINFRRKHKLSQEVYLQFQYDEQRRMKLRTFAGGGIRYTLVDRPGADVHFGSGLMYEIETWQATEGVRSSEFNKYIPKISNYVGTEFELSQHVKFYLWGLHQTGWDQEAGIRRTRFAGDATFNIIMTRKITWINRFSYFYDVHPVISINPSYYTIMNGLRITL